MPLLIEDQTPDCTCDDGKVYLVVGYEKLGPFGLQSPIYATLSCPDCTAADEEVES